jgi:glycosyltransferase involved in cell wall biosynthesis
MLIQSLSRDVTNYLIRSGVENEKIIAIPHGINFSAIEQFYETKFEESHHDWPEILMVGRLSPEKNYDLALRAFAEVKQEFPKAVLKIAGDGPCRDVLVRIAQDLQVRDSVHFLGFRKDVTSLMRKSNALLHVASTESYGRVYIEALICDLKIFTKEIGVVVDLWPANPGDFSIIENLDSSEVKSKLVEYFSSEIKKNRSKLPRFGQYQAHDQNRVFLQIADYIDKI